MDDAEISSMLKTEEAKKLAIAANEAKKGTSDYKEDYNPTPKEIEAAAKGITITPAQILEAKKEGIPQTYVGGDTVEYSSRTPIKIRKSGEGIISVKGDALGAPSQTGVEALQLAMNPDTDPQRSKLENKWWSDPRNKLQGSLDKVFNAYLPKTLRSKADIHYNSTTNKIEVTYEGEKLVITGMTDTEVNSPNAWWWGTGGSTYVEIDKLIAKAAEEIIKKRNTEFRERKGGKPSAY
jgi:hypothetical protein